MPWVAVDSGGDRLSDVRHGPKRKSERAAANDQKRGNYDYVRWLHSDGYLYVEKQTRGNPGATLRGWVRAKAVKIVRNKSGKAVAVRIKT